MENLPSYDLTPIIDQKDILLFDSFFNTIKDIIHFSRTSVDATEFIRRFFDAVRRDPSYQSIKEFQTWFHARIVVSERPPHMLFKENPSDSSTLIIYKTPREEIVVGKVTGIRHQLLVRLMEHQNARALSNLLAEAFQESHRPPRVPLDDEPTQPLLPPERRPRLSDDLLDDSDVEREVEVLPDDTDEEDSDSEEELFPSPPVERMILASFGYSNRSEMIADLKLLAREVLRDENKSLDTVSTSQVDIFMKNVMLSAILVSRLFDKRRRPNTQSLNISETLDVDEAQDMLGYIPGSATLTNLLVGCLYLIWRYILLHSAEEVPAQDNITFTWDLTSSDWGGEESTVRNRVGIPFRTFLNPRRASIISRLRYYYSYFHTKVQKALGATDEYYYHTAGHDPLRDNFVSIKIFINGLVEGVLRRLLTGRSSRIYPHYVAGDNNYWQLTLVTGRNSKFYENERKNAIMIPGCPAKGCFLRALNCVCPRGTELCCCHSDVQYDEVDINLIKEQYNHLPVLVISINVYSQSEHRNKNFQVLSLGKDFYTTEGAKVIIINNPNWRAGNAHCCLFLVPEQVNMEETDYEHFKRFSFINDFLHKICKTQHQNICPICGLLYPKQEAKAHYKTHTSELSCENCGLTFKYEYQLEVHRVHHCRHLGAGCCYDFADEIKLYQEKPDVERAIIYADLESAIEEDGTHTNILCGWVERKELKVHISREIKPLIEYAKHRPEKEVLIYFHNGEGYDFHFIIIALSKMEVNIVKKMDIICDSSEKIRYFTLNLKDKKIIFKDTFAYVSQSLSSWLESTKQSEDATFDCFKRTFTSDTKRVLVMQKNPFPYNAIKVKEDLDRPITDMNAWFTADNNTELFCDKFTKEELTEIYEGWFLLACTEFKWNTVFDYYKTYLECDVSQLCDCMEHFAHSVEREFALNVHDYYGTPSLTWAAWLRDNKYELDPIPEEAFDIINSSIRGGQTGAMTRYFNNEPDEIDEGSFCCDLDCNALYATVMLKFKFPCRRWVTLTYDSNFDNHLLLDRIEQLHASGRSGFIELDFVVHDDLSLYSYMPVASKRRVTGVYNYQTMRRYATTNGEKPENLVFTGLCNVAGEHEHYCGHTRLIEFYIRHNFITVSKVHKITYAYEEPVFEEYVNHNLEQRKKYASDPIKKMLYKLMNNALYGKTYEDVTQRTDVKIILTSEFEQLDQSEIKREIMKLDKWTVYESPKRLFTMDKPIYLGAAITEYSKLWMYRFFYEELRPRFPSCEVLYTDTDALTLKFPPECRVHSFLDLANRLNTIEHQVIDTSNWPNWKDLPIHHRQHNNEPGLFKSETGYVPITKMIALRAKTYIMVCKRDDGSEEIKMSVKGCPMKEKAKLTFKDFERVLFGDGERKQIEYGAITSKFHIVKSSQLTRVVLSPDDRKRYISDDRYHTYPLFSSYHLYHL